ncbi:MAG TPA: hypothetical protein VMW72_22650 [Sedimentisphaerales bacterium]|nr:hypothetical protein [Sedimentisphaerales bacterium]
MRQLTTKIMKSIFRIAICSIGGVLTIFGIMFGLCFLVQLPDDLSKYLPYFFLAVLTLSVGLSLCFLVIKPMRYFFVKSRKMSREEKIIHNIKIHMKQRKSRIAGITFFFIFIVSISIWMMSMGNKLARTMTPEHFRVLDLAKLMIYQWHFFLATGFIIGILIIEIAGVTKNKHRLTLSMWERIQQLENEVKELKRHSINGIGEDIC